MNMMTLIAVALAGWISRQQQDVIEYLREEVRGGELPRAAWRIAPLPLPGCGMKPTIPISGHYAIQITG